VRMGPWNKISETLSLRLSSRWIQTVGFTENRVLPTGKLLAKLIAMSWYMDVAEVRHIVFENRSIYKN
jgi:hypothetical protein